MTAWEPTANKKNSRIAAWRICRYNLRWAINPAGHSPRPPVPGPQARSQGGVQGVLENSPFYEPPFLENTNPPIAIKRIVIIQLSE